MYKDILVPYINARSAAAPLTAAIALAERNLAHVALLVIVDVPAPVPNDWTGMSYSTYLRLHEEAHQRADALAASLRERVANAAVPVEVRMADALALYPASTATLHAHYADVAVVPSLTAEDSGQVHDFFQDLLLDSGRPVLVVPPSAQTATAPKRVVVAWRPTRESARAVHDALPLLEQAEHVDVLVVDPKVGETAHGEEPGADIAAHLARHGVRVQAVARPSQGASVGAAILDYAERSGADMIVAGGYGHSRLRERMLGGATRDLLHSASLPVLFSH
ncbi:MAG: universal stress protein [Xanthomonadaceae bacterium]|nr:universal stress protein [Xanthomonadaceae bacterium]